MKQTDPQFKLRLPPELKVRIDQSAAENHRSINAEIVARLENSFDLAQVSAREPLVVVDEHGPSIDGSKLCSKTVTVLPSPSQLIGALEEVQSQMAKLQEQLIEIYKRNNQHESE